MTRTGSRALRLLSLGAAAGALTACAAVTVTNREGTIDVIAVQGCAHGTPAALKDVTVAVLEDSTLRTDAVLHPGGHVDFHLSPGHYVLTTIGQRSHVTLLAGSHVTVRLREPCVGPTR